MNLQQLQYFEVLAKEEHYTKASEKLFITQPALSKAIRNLEEEIGVPLFELNGRIVKLTRYGKIFYNYVRTATKELDEGIKKIHSLTDSNCGTVNICSIFTIAAELLPLLIKNFISHNPNVKFFTAQQSTQASLKAIMDDEIDLAFVAEFKMDDEYSSLDREVVSREEIFIAVPKEHRLAHKKEIKFSEIKDEVFVHYNTSTGMIHSVEEELNKAGYSTKDLKISFKATEDNAILGLVRAGLGIAFVADAPNVNRKGVTFLKLSDIYVYRPVYMVWRKDNYMSPAVKAFRNYVLNYVTSNHNASLSDKF